VKYAQHFQNTPQSQPLPDRAMIQNAAGGYVFAIDDWQRLRRFLILGSEGGSYYESERKLTLENASCVRRCLAADGPRVVREIVEVSDLGLAPKNDPAIFALAIATKHSDNITRKLAFDSLAKVCRIGTHLFQFAEARQAIGGGWGRGVRDAIGAWYERGDIIMQALKYQQRNGWSHRDLLRLTHPKTDDARRKAVFDAICRPAKWADVGDRLVQGYLLAQAATDAKTAAKLIADYELPRELVPTQFLTAAEVWAALLPHMGLTALVRNLGNMGKAGLLAPLSDASKIVSEKLASEEQIKRSRLHPFAILLSAKTYSGGRGVRGSGEWNVVPQVVEALDAAFNLAFHNVEPTGKKHLLGVDVSGSMSMNVLGTLSAAEAAAAMALVTARTEPNYYVMGFSTQFVDLGISAKDTLPTVLAKTRGRNFGRTDTSVAIKWALANNVGTDLFVIYTDNETWAGDRHTCEVLNDYRRKTGIPAKLAVVAFTGTNRSIADGGDPGSMDFVGMDAALPQALAAFATL
jgi:60 kDa SS-A/Ro ribonucleoprotein